MIVTEKDYRKYLLDADKNYQNQRTWGQAFSSIDLNRQLEQNAVNYSYSNAINEAYKQAYRNEQNIRGTSLIGSAKQELIDENTAALEQAFTTFSQQRAEAAANVEANAASITESLNTALNERAAKFKAYDDAHYNYLERLYEEYGNSDLFVGDNSLFGMYLTPETDDYGNVLVDKKGNPTGQMRLMTREELYSPKKDANNEYLSFYDENGNLTIRGMDFYDKMENALSATDKLSFNDYLYEINPELAEWATDVDIYNISGGTNAGSFNTVFGQTSPDYKYAFAERFGGLTSGELETKFEKFKTFAEDYKNTISKTKGGQKAKNKAEDVVNFANELSVLADELGIKEQIEDELKVITDSQGNMTNGWENLTNFIGDMFTDPAWLQRAYDSGYAKAADNGKAAGVLSGIGHFVGALFLQSNPVASSAKAVIGDAKRRKQNDTYEQDIEEAYVAMIDQLVLYANNKKRELNKQYD